MTNKKIENLIDAIEELTSLISADYQRHPYIPREEKDFVRESIRGRLREALIRVLEDGHIRG